LKTDLTEKPMVIVIYASLCSRTQFDIIRLKEINEHSNPRLAVLDKDRKECYKPQDILIRVKLVICEIKNY